MINRYLPLTAGWIDYQVFDVECTLPDKNLRFDIVKQTPNGYPFQRSTRIPVGSITGFVDGPGGVVCNKIDPLQTLYNGEIPDGIGEVINNVDGGEVQFPGILECPDRKDYGNGVIGTSLIIRKDPISGVFNTFPYPWEHKVIYTGPWSNWPDTIRSGLHELQGQYYNYVHALDIGAVDLWYGVIKGDKLIGNRFYAVDWSK